VATAAAITICEAEQVVEPGALDPDQVHLPGIYVKRLVQGAGYQKWIERRTVRARPGEGR
jgi:3-oxoacid CoA-transferase subunit A